ncbi:MAG: hypothetical protein K5871_00205 [Lachnospiraceae bacterium]|nr:hypothetical protein [Lachnospiraceae bacterium]
MKQKKIIEKKDVRSDGAMHCIIGNGSITLPDELISKRYTVLPDLYMDAVAFKYGLDGGFPVSEQDIASELSFLYHIDLNEDLVSGILNDSLYMLSHDITSFAPVEIKDSFLLEDSYDFIGGHLTWKNIFEIMAGYENEEWLDQYLDENISPWGCVTIPRIDEIYTQFETALGKVDGLPQVLTFADVLDYRDLASYVIKKLDEMGTCLVSDMFDTCVIHPNDILKYAYLDTDLAMKIIHDNPVTFLWKLKLTKLSMH